MATEQVIGNETREVKARLIEYGWNELSQTGFVMFEYFYTINDVDVKVSSHRQDITSSPATQAKRDTLLGDAVTANPIP